MWDWVDKTAIFSLIGGFLTLILTAIRLMFGNKKLKIENREKEISFLRSQIEKLQAENNELRTKIDNLQNQIVELKSQNDNGCYTRIVDNNTKLTKE